MASPQSKRAKPEISVLTKDDVHTDKYPSLSRPLTPLTPLREDIVADHWAESDDKWQRCAETGYRLPGESEKALVGPLYPDTARPEVRLGSLSKAKKKLLREIFSDIVEEWPTSNSLEHADSLALSLVNQDVFLMECVQIPLGKRANRAGNANSSTTAYDLVKVIEAPATKDVSCQQIYSLFRGYVIERIKRCEAASGKNDFVPSHFKKCWDASNDYREIFSGARRSGRKCRQDAVWIGLERLADDEVEAFNNRHFVETREQVEKGLESGAFDEDGYILINGLMHRICAPPAEDQRMRSIILWTKDGPDDENPTWNKVFGGVVYNVHKLDKTFGDENQLVTDEMTGVELAVQYVFIDRSHRIATGGTMVKAPGHQAAFGQPYQATIYSQIKPMEVTSKNPKPATIEKVQKIEQLRMRMKHGTAVLQGKHWEFLSGFLHPFAEVQLNAAKQATGSINRLGYPNTSAFGTYAYCASSHVDRDDSCTCGWVMRRSAQMKRSESNFVWSSHGVVIEMAERLFWFWDAPNDSHGTTTNDLALSHPANYGAYIKSAPDRAQWTRVTVLPSAVLAADIRKDNE
ncbi:hypothetical protein FPV67DRAFT_1445537 [Lyophyllum atratum]|nr:hypothetical protein FPV67DRAFT_1445537 [Lyophyllum atratum]